MSKQIRANIMLIIASIIWGGGYIVNKGALETLDPYSVSVVRGIFGGGILLIAYMLMRRGKPPLDGGQKIRSMRAGVICGVLIFVGNNAQQFGLTMTDAGKAGFISSLYVVLIPLFSALMGKKLGLRRWFSVFLALTGLVLLCDMLQTGFALQLGDIFLLLGAVFYALHILAIEHFAAGVPAVLLAALQFFVNGAISLVISVLFYRPSLGAFLPAFWPLFYLCVLSTAVAFGFQVAAQRDTPATVACLLLSMESVFAALSGWLFGGEHLTTTELVGCALMGIAIILAQLPSKKGKAPKQPPQPQ